MAEIVRNEALGVRWEKAQRKHLQGHRSRAVTFPLIPIQHSSPYSLQDLQAAIKQKAILEFIIMSIIIKHDN